MLKAQLRLSTACKLILSTGTVFAATAFAPQAMAQDSDIDADAVAQPNVADAGDGVEEIVVTARRREERLIDVPISLTAIGGEALSKQGTQSLEQVGEQVPNLTLEVSRGTNTTLTAFIRGVGQQDPVAGFEAGVGLYVDDVYLNRPQAAVLDVYDVERIEVLRGPQGTLYGRNTIGGAIKYVTARLPDETQVKVRGTYGSYDQADLIVSAATPVSDALRVGVAGARLSRGGYGKNLNLDGVENYNKDVWAARGTVEYENGPLFIRLAGDYVKDNSDPRQGHRFLPGNPALSDAPVLNNVYNTRAGLNVTKQEVEAYGGSLNIAYEISDTITLKSITGYRKDESTSPIDFDSLPVVDLDVPAIYKNDQLSEELQFLYEGDRLSGVLGAYYLDANAFTAFDVAIWQTGDLIGLPGLTAQTLGDVNTKTWSIFGDFTYELTDQFSLSLGGRYTNDKRSSRVLRTTYILNYSDLFADGGVPIAVTSDFDGSDTFKEFTPRASISFKPNRDHNIYFTYSKGFKGGGFDPRGYTTNAPDADGDGTVSEDEIFNFMRFKPETVDSFELGWKASLLQNRLNVSLAGFMSDYKNIQIPGSKGYDVDGDGITETFIGVTTNAAAATINGIEFEANALVGRDFAGMGSRFNVNMALGYVDAKYDEYFDGDTDISGIAAIQNTPEFTANWGFDMGIPAASGMVDLIGSISLRSDSQQFEFATPFLDQDGFFLANASLVYTADSDAFQVGLHAKNIFDKRYVVAGYDFVYNTQLGLENNVTGFYGDPRRVFVTAEVRF
ncbi:TonB-dependent receptor [Croceicoccus mobilis]|uniref:TonB-dependent receptor n=1 Tax=Croceicoccus mobilis TaxID=1703339 RepID=A0A917DXJ2_9SPHN|nr:TonB-dependent receptor [Croceicoccus mobilis]GGD79679.1 TonB-dependent receptor [Croceicoccus mobilis]